MLLFGMFVVLMVAVRVLGAGDDRDPGDGCDPARELYERTLRGGRR